MALRFTTTRLTGLRAAGRIVELQHAVIASFLQRELGPAYGRLFADFEPEGSDLRAWYAEVETQPRRVADLSPDRRAVLLATTADMVRDIRALAGRMAGESTQKANLARALVAATTFPEEDVWCDADQPIVVNWGFSREDKPESAPRAITGLVARPEPAPRSALAAAFGWWGARVRGLARAGVLAPLLWLVFAVLVASTYRLLLPACGIGDGPVLDACAAPLEAADAAEEGSRLQDLVRQAELQLAQQRQVCTAPVVPGRRASIDAGPRLPPGAARGDRDPVASLVPGPGRGAGPAIGASTTMF